MPVVPVVVEPAPAGLSSQKKWRHTDATSAMPVEILADILRDGPGSLREGWAGWENTRLAHIRLMYEAMAETPDYPEGAFAGRGIVISVNAKPGQSSGKFLPQGYFPGAWVVVRELRRLGCTLPVTFAHMGPLEWDPSLTKLVEPLGVTVMDLEAEHAKPHPVWKPMRILAGWESKVDAIARSPYEEVLYLDADNIPLRDPTYLFDSDTFTREGCVLWPDVAPHDRPAWLPKEVWHNFDLPDLSGAGIVDAESGQVLIHKRLWWRELNLCRWMNGHSDWIYNFVFGDKSTFLLSCYRVAASDGPLERPRYFMPERRPGGNFASLVQHGPSGEALFQHLTRNKPSLSGFPHPGAVIVRSFADGHLEELRGLWSGKIWHNPWPKPKEALAAALLTQGVWRYQRTGTGNDRQGRDERPMTFMSHSWPDIGFVGRVGEGMAACEVAWDIVADGDDVVLVIKDLHGAPTVFLRPESSDGEALVGRWVVHEKCQVRLERV